MPFTAVRALSAALLLRPRRLYRYLTSLPAGLGARPLYKRGERGGEEDGERRRRIWREKEKKMEREKWYREAEEVGNGYLFF